MGVRARGVGEDGADMWGRAVGDGASARVNGLKQKQAISGRRGKWGRGPDAGSGPKEGGRVDCWAEEGRSWAGLLGWFHGLVLFSFSIPNSISYF